MAPGIEPTRLSKKNRNYTMSNSSPPSSNLPTFQSSNLPSFHPSDRLFDESFLRKLERLAILSRRAMAGQLQGERRSPKRGQSVEFADFRAYVPGDDFRRIDWNAYARLERFFIKLFVEEEDLTVHLLVDTSRSMDWGQPNKLWYAVRAAGALGYVALAGLDRVTVTAFGEGGNGDAHYFPPRRGKGQALALFSFLQTLGAGSRTDLAPRLRAYAAAATQPGPLLLFSDLLDDGWADGLRALASRGFEVTVLHILAPDEVNPDTSTWLSEGAAADFKLLDVETGAEVEITADYDLLGRYRDGLAAWREELRRFCGARGMHYVPVETSLPFEELLFAWLRRLGVLK
jgi:uncharacterized protein (DUF58 family)